MNNLDLPVAIIGGGSVLKINTQQNQSINTQIQ